MKKTRQTAGRPELRKETLRHLRAPELTVVAGGTRMWRPGFAPDTTPIWEWVDDTNG